MDLELPGRAPDVPQLQERYQDALAGTGIEVVPTGKSASFRRLVPSVQPPTFVEEPVRAALRAASEKLDKLSMLYAILLQPETYEKIATCGKSASMLSIAFCDAAFNTTETDPSKILETIGAARKKLEDEYQKDFEPARAALVEEFRNIMDPTIKQKEANS